MGKGLRASAVFATTLLVTAVLVATPVSAATPRCFDRKATIVGTPGNDQLRGTPGRDVIVGKAGDDTIRGLKGADWVCGGGGNDTIAGGRGIDLLFGDKGDDDIAGQRGAYNQILPGLGDDLVDGGPAEGDEVIYLDAEGPIVGDLAAGTVTGHGSDTIVNTEWLTGGAFDDVLSGTTGNNALFGGRGADQLFSLDGDDYLAGGGGNDQIDGGPGFDYLDSLFFSIWYPPFNPIPGPVVVDLVAGTATGQGDDTLTAIEGSSGSPADDVMTGNAQDNEFTQLFEGADTVSAGAGADTVDGGEGVDTLTGGPGVDLLGLLDSPAGMTVDLRVPSDSDGDTLSGFENILGTFFDDDLTGNNVANWISGFDGDDTISGRTGDDTLIGDLGEDSANGGAGTDACDAETETACEAEPPAGRTIRLRSAYFRNGLR
ncbi:MAG: calcium-binding protein [Actinomycetota bacterium]